MMRLTEASGAAFAAFAPWASPAAAESRGSSDDANRGVEPGTGAGQPKGAEPNADRDRRDDPVMKREMPRRIGQTLGQCAGLEGLAVWHGQTIPPSLRGRLPPPHPRRVQL
jgi:hypothetical protein